MLRMNIIKNKKQLFGFIFFVFLIPIIISQGAEIAEINIEHTGYGQTSQEAYFSIYNTGNIQLTNITIFVDGKEYKKIVGMFSPGIGLMTSLYLNPGDHFIEAKTPEGAYDSLTLKISKAREILVPPKQTETPFISKNTVIYVALSIVIIIFVVVVWLLSRKTKLELKEAQYQQYS